MVIFISPDELEVEYIESWKLNWVKNPSIDYATNSIHAVFENKEVIIFKFDKYGFINDNRYNFYELSAGKAGITIRIIKNEKH